MISQVLVVAILNALAAASPLKARAASTVITDLGTLGTDLTTLTSDIIAFNGDIFDALPIESAANTLETDIQTAISDTTSSSAFSTSDSATVATTFVSLEPLVLYALGNLTAKESEAASDGLNSLIVSTLQTLQSDTDSLGTALEAKTTSSDASKISTAVTAINSAFAATISAFS